MHTYSDSSRTYTIDSYTADGFSDLTITGATNYSSYSTLVCDIPGVPVSWNNKPEFSVSINENGEVTSVGIINGGKGFYPQGSDTNRQEKNFYIYFTGGGGSGAFATYGTDIGAYSLETRRKPIGSIYTAEGAVEVVTVVSGGTGYKTAPQAIVIDYNTTWKEFYLHDKTYDFANWSIDRYNSSLPFGPFQMIDFYFKNAIPYESRFAIKNQASYYPSSIDSERSSKSGSNYQSYLSSLAINSTGFELYAQINDRGWIGYNSLFDNAGYYNPDRRNTVSPVSNKYVIDYYYNNGYLNDVLYESENKYMAYPHDSTNISIANNGHFANLVDGVPSFIAIKPSWNTDLISDTVLVRNSTIE
jgi:hypothetical protein